MSCGNATCFGDKQKREKRVDITLYLTVIYTAICNITVISIITIISIIIIVFYTRGTVSGLKAQTELKLTRQFLCLMTAEQNSVSLRNQVGHI